VLQCHQCPDSPTRRGPAMEDHGLAPYQSSGEESALADAEPQDVVTGGEEEEDEGQEEDLRIQKHKV
jgi:hypothetical protein